MTIAPLSLRNQYWEDLTITEQDLEFLYNYLLDTETPLTAQELAQVLVTERIRKEIAALEQRQKGDGDTYLPKKHYEVGQKIHFPALSWKVGEVVSVRDGKNPEHEPFEVINVRFDQDYSENFAAGLEDHKLNEPITINHDDPALMLEPVIKKYGKSITNQINDIFSANDDLVQIAGRWFPRSLLVDVNIGYLNLAEAVLEMENGGPLTTQRILEQIELPTDVNLKLTEFSLNLALQEDERFDEVGPAGEVLWHLHRLEPEGVQKPPLYLRYQAPNIHAEALGPVLERFEAMVADELEVTDQDVQEINELTLSLIFPHWRAGTIPLTHQVAQLFPTAYESPRVQFTFVDGDSGERFSGWVVRANRYIFGLREWYQKMDLIPGSLIRIQRSNQPGEVIVSTQRKRPTKEWIRTVLVGADGGVVFAMLKQQVASVYDERMAIALADPDALDSIWQQPRQRVSLENTVLTVMRELTKLNPQGQVHAQDLYAAINVIRRCSPAAVLYYLIENPAASHLGDLYFRLDETSETEDDNE